MTAPSAPPTHSASTFGRSILLTQRMLLVPSAGGQSLRVVMVEAATDGLWLARTDSTGWPGLQRLGEVQAQVDDGTLIASTEAVVLLPPSRPASETAGRRRWELVRPLVENDDLLAGLLDPTTRGGLISNRVEEVLRLQPDSKVSRQHLSSLLIRFFARGMTPLALGTDYRNCGGAGRPRVLGVAKVGRPRTLDDRIGINATPQVQRHLLIGAVLVRDRRGDLQDGYREVLSAYYLNDAGDVIEDRPSFQQFSYFYRTRFPEAERRRARIGSARFELSARAMHGRADQHAVGPGSCFTIDSTTSDQFLVSEFDRTALVGRPTLYLVSDDFSHIITGLYASYEPPCWEGAMMALVNVVEDKVEFCARFGIEIAPEEWPCNFLPRALASDRGEGFSAHADGVADRLRFRFATAASGRGDMKAICERDFGSVQKEYGPYLPGYVERDFGTRGQERDYRRDAKLTLAEYVATIIYAILEHNSNPVSKRTALPEMVAAGLTASPLDFWRYGLAARSGRLRTFAPEEVALAVMRRGSATVDAHGIRFERGHYVSRTAAALGWAERARSRGVFKVDVAFDPRSMDSIYLVGPDVPKGYERIELNAALSADHRGKSLSELRDFYARSKIVERSGEDARMTATIKRRQKVQALRAAAVEATEDAQRGGPSPPQRVKQMKDHRARERSANRQSEAFTSSAPTTLTAPAEGNPILPPVPSTMEVSREERLAREQRERRARRDLP